MERNSRDSKLGLLLTGNLLLITRTGGKIMAEPEMPALGSRTMTDAYFLMPLATLAKYIINGRGA